MQIVLKHGEKKISVYENTRLRVDEVPVRILSVLCCMKKDKAWLKA